MAFSLNGDFKCPLLTREMSPDLRSLWRIMVKIGTLVLTYFLQNPPPGVKPVHVDDDKEKVKECSDGHEERQLPNESRHQVEGLLLLVKSSNGRNNQLMPCFNLGSWWSNILYWKLPRKITKKFVHQN